MILLSLQRADVGIRPYLFIMQKVYLTNMFPDYVPPEELQEALSQAMAERDVEKIFTVFANDPLVSCGMEKAREMFNEMCENTKAYLTSYNL